MGNKADEVSYQITAMAEQHVEDVFSIEQVSFPTPWSKEAYYNELRDNDVAHYYVCLAGEQVIGYAGMWVIIDEAHITNIAVHPEFRGRNVAQTLLLNLIQEALRLGVRRLTLEVRPTNKVAQHVYRKYGFCPVGIRKGYYSDNAEDAVIMWKNLYEG